MPLEARAVLGIDAAWTDSQASGIALLTESDSGWRCVRVASSLGTFTPGLVWDGPGLDLDAELPIALETCHELLGHGRIEIVAVDMPLAHAPITGRREADNQISRMFGHCKCAVHSPTPARPGAFGRRMHEHLAGAGFSLATQAGALSPALIEVYPHVALLGMMEVPERLPYKAAKTGKYWPGTPLTTAQEWSLILERLQNEIPGQPAQIRPRHHAQGQGPEWRPRPPAPAHLDHVPEVPRRPGASSARTESQLAGEALQTRHRSTLPLARLGRRPQGLTGDELLAFINNEKPCARTARSGPACSPTCAKLTSANGDNRRDVIATVFRGVDNRMKSGYLLRDVVNKIDAIHFTPATSWTPSARLYESMLREMRDAAGDSGEFYTPRAVVRFMVNWSATRAWAKWCWTRPAAPAAFLVEAFMHLAQAGQDRHRPQAACRSAASSAASPSHCPICCAR
jgi:hypothetical protein